VEQGRLGLEGDRLALRLLGLGGAAELEQDLALQLPQVRILGLVDEQGVDQLERLVGLLIW
jgi:hypothetical protein